MASKPRAGAVGTAADRRWMARCLALAARGAGRTAPNPMVGCVIVKAGRVLAEGWHRGPGTAHAEADALARLGGRARGATLYVNLEPCDHQGRTPPCAPAVIASGVRRVVIGAMDPILGHGGGARRLARAGIAVVPGVLADACVELNRPFFTWAEHARPWIILKAAASADGRIALPSGESQWITGAEARADGHRLRDQVGAILVGIGTVLADDPRLTTRGVPGGRDPIRVVLDSRLRTPVGAALLPGVAGGGRAIIATTARAPATRRRRLETAGAEVWTVRADRRGQVDVRAVAARLAAAGVTSMLVEGGPTTHASFVAAGIADELRLYLAPCLLGAGPGWLGELGVTTLARAPRWHRYGEPVALGADLLVRLRQR